MTCTICTDAFTNGASRQPVVCAACSHAACTRCVKAFLLTTPEPNCMNCRVPWNREFLDLHVTKSWREGPLKEHRAAFLFDRERSMLPATQPAVEIELQKRAYAAEIPDLVAKCHALKEELATVQGALDRRQFFIRNGHHLGSGPEKEKRKFVAACPSDCRGFLSTAYKCGTCQTQYCADCREPKHSASEDAVHTCDPALVATIAAIVKDSKPCPNCGTAISKVSGCDQMYCTSCDTAYSYDTGKVATGVIHNPHYFEKMQALKGAVPQQPGACGWPNFHHLPVAIRGNDIARNLFRLAQHTEHVSLPRYAAAADNSDLRVRYLLKELDEEGLKRTLQQRDRKRQKELEIRAPLELFVVTALEFFLDAPTVAKLPAFAAQIEEHVNVPLRAIGARYANKVPQIDLIKGEFVTV